MARQQAWPELWEGEALVFMKERLYGSMCAGNNWPRTPFRVVVREKAEVQSVRNEAPVHHNTQMRSMLPDNLIRKRRSGYKGRDALRREALQKLFIHQALCLD